MVHPQITILSCQNKVRNKLCWPYYISNYINTTLGISSPYRSMCSLKALVLYKGIYVIVQYSDIKVPLSAVSVSFPRTSPSGVLRGIGVPLHSTATLLVSFLGVCVIIGSFSSGGGSTHLSWLLLSSGLSLAARDQWLWTLPLLYGQAKQPFLH